MHNATMVDHVDRDELITEIVTRVVAEIRPLLRVPATAPKRIASSAEMARILEWSLPKLQRATGAGDIPSLMHGGRRSYVIDDVIEALRQSTPEHEKAAAIRQAAKTAAKSNSAGSDAVLSA